MGSAQLRVTIHIAALRLSQPEQSRNLSEEYREWWGTYSLVDRDNGCRSYAARRRDFRSTPVGALVWLLVGGTAGCSQSSRAPGLKVR